MPRKLTDDDLLNLARNERQRSVGFDNDDILVSERIRALEYDRGVMRDVPHLENRSAATASDIPDAIETIMPDLVEIFATGDDDFAFEPNDENDEAQAKLETDYVTKVVFHDNDGFMLLTTILRDALLLKCGIAGWAWEDGQDKVETFENQSRDMAMARLAPMLTGQVRADVDDAKEGEPTDDGEQTITFTLRTPQPGKLRTFAFPPEDFTVASDTVQLRDTTYCAVRTRPRLQQLIADGLKRKDVENLPTFGSGANEEATEFARDSVQERNRGVTGGGDEPGDLRTVEVVAHTLRVDADGDGQPELHYLLTGADETVLLDHEVRDRVQYAAVKPFLITHRFYGQSIADKLMEVQKVKTALMRMMLDSGYFAINQRHQVVVSGVNENTYDDLLDNTPGMPVRVKSPDTITPLTSSPPGFDMAQALEYWSTVAEQRTGVVRNAQGLNPDTLHDTASGQAALMTMAQKRVRMIARMLAETGLKDLYLGVHAELRKRSTDPIKVKLNGQWTTINPSMWPERKDMTVDIGHGASGKEVAQAELQRIFPLMQLILQAQGEASGGNPLAGPFITGENVYAYLQKVSDSVTLKGADRFWSDPAQAPPQPPKGPPPPDPQVLKQQSDDAKAQRQHEADGTRLALEHDKAQSQMALERDKLAQDKELKLAELAQNRELAIMKMHLEAQAKERSDSVDLAVQASESEDVHLTQANDHAENERQRSHEADLAREARETAAYKPGGDDE